MSGLVYFKCEHRLHIKANAWEELRDRFLLAAILDWCDRDDLGWVKKCNLARQLIERQTGSWKEMTRFVFRLIFVSLSFLSLCKSKMGTISYQKTNSLKNGSNRRENLLDLTLYFWRLSF